MCVHHRREFSLCLLMHLLERATYTPPKLASQSWWLYVWYSKLRLFSKHGYYTCAHAHACLRQQLKVIALAECFAVTFILHLSHAHTNTHCVSCSTVVDTQHARYPSPVDARCQWAAIPSTSLRPCSFEEMLLIFSRRLICASLNKWKLFVTVFFPISLEIYVRVRQ